MKHLFSINAEGGPLLCLDARAATGWKGCEAGSTDYENLCARFDAQLELPSAVLTVGEHSAVAWEMSGPGTADVFEAGEGRIRIVRAWLDEDTPEEIEQLASADAPSHVDVGEIEIPSGSLAVLWAPESGQKIPFSTERDVQRVLGIHPVTVMARLLTLVLIFAFQAENLTTRWLAVLLLAVPIIIQVYFNSTLAYLLMRWFKVPQNVASPGALIGAGNFFELAVAVGITLFGPSSGAAMATVGGVLVEVPVMLSVGRICNQSCP